MNGDDVTHHNKSIPWWPDEMPWWQRVLCVLGYHKWETRQTAKGHCYGFETEEGKRKGRFGLHDETPMKLTDQCSRCGAPGFPNTGLTVVTRVEASNADERPTESPDVAGPADGGTPG